MEPVELKENVWWVANRSESLLEVNVYLLTYPHDKGQTNVMLDPGPTELLNHLQKKVQPIIGGLNKLHALLINHQDPDVAPNAGFIQKMNPNCMVVASEDTWRLIRFFGLKQNRFKPVESFPTRRVSMPGGQQLVFVPSPFCHFRGAIMYYDVTSRILFSGDLFGGLSYSQDLYATEESWEGIKTFHQLYMPSREALQLAVSLIRNLKPAPEMIAPQHGSIIKGDLVPDFIDRMYNLQVGLDLLKERERKENFIGAANELLEELEKDGTLGSVAERIKRWNEDSSFTNIIGFKDGRVVEFKADPPTAMKSLIDLLRQDVGTEKESLISLVALKALIGRNIPIGDILPAEEEEDLPDYFE
ncbi:MAG: MBL fold hydrolase [Thermodesulfobacteriota bacterium]